MKAVFADTFYWVALTSIEDPAYLRAMALSRSLAPDTIIVTTDEVLCEYLAFFAGARSSIRDQAGRQDRYKLYRARPDKGYSLVDCVSMQTMRREGLTRGPHQRSAF